VESAHGQLNGAVLLSNGRSAPLIVGPLLDGKNGRALVWDTDAGGFDGDTTYDRAMGPLGLTPTEWRAYGIDADGDGIQDPYGIYDASLAMARLLCSSNEDLSQRAGWDAAIARHHPGSAYNKSVFTFADSYGQKTKDLG
jgi:membrane-bound lytic murein transglycosylase B